MECFCNSESRSIYTKYTSCTSQTTPHSLPRRVSYNLQNKDCILLDIQSSMWSNLTTCWTEYPAKYKTCWTSVQSLSRTWRHFLSTRTSKCGYFPVLMTIYWWSGTTGPHYFEDWGYGVWFVIQEPGIYSLPSQSPFSCYNHHDHAVSYLTMQVLL